MQSVRGTDLSKGTRILSILDCCISSSQPSTTCKYEKIRENQSTILRHIQISSLFETVAAERLECCHANRCYHTRNTLTGPKWPNSRGLIFHGVPVSSRPPQLPAGSCLDNQNHAKTAGNTPFEHWCCSKGANRMKLPGDMQAVKFSSTVFAENSGNSHDGSSATGYKMFAKGRSSYLTLANYNFNLPLEHQKKSHCAKNSSVPGPCSWHQLPPTVDPAQQLGHVGQTF